jgi:hypothetical protein
MKRVKLVVYLVSFVSGSSCNLALVARSKFSEITVIVTLPADKS